jgi:prolyl oligopeptidase PreP (S9A serine peptidase family)
MRAKAWLLAVTVVLAAAPSAHQRPNFSGRWVITSPPEGAGREQVVTQDDKTLTVEMLSASGSRKTIYQLDGVERQQALPMRDQEIVLLVRASWDGDRIVIASNTAYPNGMKTQSKEIWSLDAKGRLTIDYSETGPTGPGPGMKVVYVKKP